MGRDLDRDTRPGWVSNRLPRNSRQSCRAIRQARPRAQGRQIWWLRCPGNVTPMWGSEHLPVPSAPGFWARQVSTFYKHHTQQTEPGQAVRGTPPEGRSARTRRMPGARTLSLVRALHHAACPP